MPEKCSTRAYRKAIKHPISKRINISPATHLLHCPTREDVRGPNSSIGPDVLFSDKGRFIVGRNISNNIFQVFRRKQVIMDPSRGGRAEAGTSELWPRAAKGTDVLGRRLAEPFHRRVWSPKSKGQGPASGREGWQETGFQWLHQQWGG